MRKRHMHRATVVLGLLLLGALGAGCGDPVYLSDDEGGHRDSSTSLFGAHPDELSQPYALGARMNIEVKGITDRGRIASWRAESSRPEVFAIDKVSLESDRLVLACRAAGAGQSTLRVVDDGGEERASAQLEVVAPDSVRLFAHEAMRLLGTEATSLDAAAVGEARGVVGGTAVYAVGYFQGSRHLFGRGLLAAEGPVGLLLQPRTTEGGPVNEWLFVTGPGEVAGSLRIKNSADGRLLGEVPVAVVPPSAVTGLVVAQEPAGQKREDETVWVGLHGVDAQQRRVDGLPASWTVGGVAQVGKDGDTSKTTGDLLRYTLASATTPREVVASFGTLRATTSIRAARSWVMDTTYLGCGMGRRGAPSTLGTLGLLAAALLVRGTRRRGSGRS